jgi:hypothetical protein
MACGRPALDLIVTMDDATSTIYSAFLVEEEGTISDVSRTASRCSPRIRLGNLPSSWDGFRRPAALGFRVLLLMKRLQSRGVGFAKRRAQFAAMQVLLDLDRLATAVAISAKPNRVACMA